MQTELSSLSRVVKRDGRVVLLDSKKIASVVLKAASAVQDHKKIDVEKVVDDILRSLRARFCDDHPPSVEDISDTVEKMLIENKYADVAKAYILYRQRRTEERKAKESLIGGLPVTNKKITINSLRVLKERYLLKDKDGKIVETPDQLFWRIANNIALAETKYNPTADTGVVAQKFYDIMSNMDFMPNSPTLMNAGTHLQQLSACFVLPIDDSMEGIFTTLLHTALIHKSGGGTGFSFSRLRPRNSVVLSTKGVASGPVSFMKVYNAATEVIKQGGKRRGANMGILRVDHPDILEFINAKEKNDEIANFNISVALTDDFMHAVEGDVDYELKDPRTKVVVGRQSARMVFDMLVGAAWRNGDPGVVFIDRMNRDNPTPQLGEIESTNPCGEQPLLPYESCNLGSINLGNFVVGKAVDWARLRDVVHVAIRFLDNVIDMNRFPIPEIASMTLANRKVGLGVMGWADMLVQLEVPYNSDEGVRLAEDVMGFVKREADNASEMLACARGPFLNWKDSVYCKDSSFFAGVHRPMRNATRTTIAPTGTISMISECSSGIEPLFALSYVKRVMDGKELFYMDKNFRKALEERGLYDDALVEKIVNQGSIKNIEELPVDLRRIFVVAHDIIPDYHVRMQAAFQKYTDNAVSKTVNFSHSATIEDVRNVYLSAFRTGCKGITMYRDGSKENQVLNLNINIKKDAEKKKEVPVEKKCPECGTEMELAEGCCKCHSCGYSACSV